MTDNELIYYPYACFTNAQFPLLKVVALYFDKLVILDPAGGSLATIGADHHAHEGSRKNGITGGTIMELKLLTDLINVLGKVASGLKAIVNLPKAERDATRRKLDDTYRLIDTTLNMLTIGLGNILLLGADDGFLREAARLDNYNEWMQADREFRLSLWEGAH